MELINLLTKNRIKIIIIAIFFMIINILTVLLIFNAEFYSTFDRDILKTQFNLIAIGISLVAFFISLTFLKYLNIKRLFIIFLITHVALFVYFNLFQYSVEMDFYTFIDMAEHVLDGDLFTPYFPGWIANWWRIGPPMYMWWYTYNFMIYGLDPIIWRFVNLLLDIGIVYAMIRIFQETNLSQNKQGKENFKIGLLFYIFSIFPIFTFILMAFITALPVLLGLLGFFFYLRSQKEPGNIYISIFFFSLCALTMYFAAIWILGILLLLLFRKKIKLFFVLAIEIIAIFVVVNLPSLINDALGFMKLFLGATLVYYASNWNGSIFIILPGILGSLPSIIAISLLLIFIYKNHKQEINLDYFIVILSFFLFFTPHFAPWYFPWIFPLICINLIYSFRKYLIANLFFLSYFLVFILLFAIAYLIYPNNSSFLNWTQAWSNILKFMDSNGFLLLIRYIGHTLYQLGFMYLIYAYTNDKRWIYTLVLVWIPFFTLSILL